VGNVFPEMYVSVWGEINRIRDQLKYQIKNVRNSGDSLSLPSEV
jgi:hypothetical protein